MAGLKRTQRRGNDVNQIDNTYLDDGHDAAGHRRPSVRPRFGTGARPAPERRRRADGLMQWRLLAFGACALILGTGVVIALRAMAPAASDPVASAPAASAPAPALATASAAATARAAPAENRIPATAPVVPAPGAATSAPQAPEHAQMASQVATLLGAGAPVQAEPPKADAKVASAEPAPTADDFARPAFLEPVDGDEADLPEGAAEAAGDTAPLPTPRPAAASAEADKDGGRTARIRSDVTLRSGPRRSASAIGTLDEGTRVTLYSCKSWCEVSTGDKRGFVYKAAVAQ